MADFIRKPKYSVMRHMLTGMILHAKLYVLKNVLSQSNV